MESFPGFSQARRTQGEAPAGMVLMLRRPAGGGPGRPKVVLKSNFKAFKICFYLSAGTLSYT